MQINVKVKYVDNVRISQINICVDKNYVDNYEFSCSDIPNTPWWQRVFLT